MPISKPWQGPIDWARKEQSVDFAFQTKEDLFLTLVCLDFMKVMIYRLITRGTIEERMMQMTKKKMVLEHVVVGRMKTNKNLNQVGLISIFSFSFVVFFGREWSTLGKTGIFKYEIACFECK